MSETPAIYETDERVTKSSNVTRLPAQPPKAMLIDGEEPQSYRKDKTPEPKKT